MKRDPHFHDFCLPRPAFDRLCRDAGRRHFDVVMAWSVAWVATFQQVCDDALVLLRDATLDRR